MMARFALSFVLLFLLFAFSCAVDKIVPGATWKDTSGNTIHAHGGGVLYYKGVYYWYGEIQDPNTVGANCYSSTDLYNWKYEGVAFRVPNATLLAESQNQLLLTYILERPKVLYNKDTGKFVMWVHLDDTSYSFARVGVATSTTPTGPFSFLYSIIPNGQESRDQTVYQDASGVAYLIRSSGHTNLGIAVSALTGDYLNVSTQVSYISQSREAPAVLFRNKIYYLILSHCSGWDTNPADLWTSASLNGAWSEIGNPTGSSNTFNSQSTFFLPVQGQYEGNFIFMADRWNYPNLPNATYIWLPVQWSGNTMKIAWFDSWDLSFFGSN